MRTILPISIFTVIFLALSIPAMANPDRDYIEERLDAWMSYAEDLGYEIIEYDIDTIRSDQSLYYDLEPGNYHAYAEGGSDITDLDMQALDDRGRELDSDYLADNYPVVDFTINDSGEVEFCISVYEFERRANSDYYCFVLAREEDYYDNWRGNDRHDRDGRNRRQHRDDWNNDNWDDNYYDDQYDDNWDDNYYDDGYNDGWDGSDDYYDWDGWCDDYNNWDWHDNYDRDYDYTNSERRQMVEDSLNDLYDFAYDRGHNPIMDDVAEISDTATYDLTLDRGYYVVFASGGTYIDDLDLLVTDRDGWNIAEDINPDANPAVWFYLPERTTVQIEAEVWGFTDWNDEDWFCILVCER